MNRDESFNGRKTPAPPPPWRGDAYARQSAHHRLIDDWFIRRRPPKEDDIVVDIGCGSGEFTAALAEMASGGTVIGVDMDRSMLAAARRHEAPKLSFAHGLAQEVDRIVEPGSVDLVVSRAMLHWMPPAQHGALYQAVLRVLKAGGAFHLESAGPGNIPGVIDLLNELAAAHRVPAPPQFPDPGRTLERLEEAGFDLAEDSVRTVAGRRAFTREQLVGFLRTQAVLVLTRHADPERAQAITEEAVAAADRLRRHDGSYDQTFVRLELLACRPG
jgi:ubiquinone/menaquinone biosynthesis C-methylase UbiE